MGACPYIVQNYLGESWLWSHELFPGCSPPPFSEEVGCTGDCPTPCREQVVRDGSTAATVRYSYARGRLVAADGETYFAPTRRRHHSRHRTDAGCATPARIAHVAARVQALA